jgi:hypothetical protein
MSAIGASTGFAFFGLASAGNAARVSAKLAMPSPVMKFRTIVVANWIVRPSVNCAFNSLVPVF